jgi:hypothetical protein
MTSVTDDKPEVTTKEFDYLDEDKPIRGQNFVLLSFLSPEDVIVNKEAYIFQKFIEKFSKKYEKGLKMMIPVVLFVGYALMATMFYLLYQTVKIYLTQPEITRAISAPPIMPLLPYFPQIFHVESFFPPFYFTYFLVALLVVAVVHEFSHGIYMKLFKTKIKSTGFAFLGPILGAFVEEDKAGFYKKKNFEQMVVLGAGVFANILFALIFFSDMGV